MKRSAALARVLEKIFNRIFGSPEPVPQPAPKPKPAPPPPPPNRPRSKGRTCDDDVYDPLRQVVEYFKNLSDTLGGCSGQKGLDMSKEDLLLRAEVWKKLADARKEFEDKCWGGGDDVHKQRIKSDLETADKCKERASRK